MKTPLVVDIETDGGPAQTGRLLCIGWQLADEDQAHAEPTDDTIWHGPGQTLGDMLADPERPVVTMTKYDARYLRLQGWEVTGPFYDLQVMAWVLNENQTLSLDLLAKRYLGLVMDKRLKRRAGELMFQQDDGESVPLPGAPLDQVIEYCKRDVEAETRLFNCLWASLESTAWLDYFLEEEVPFTEVLVGVEVAGLPVDLEASEELREALEAEHELLHAELIETGGLPETFNLNSGDQLASYLYFPVMELADAVAHEPGTYNGMSKEDKLAAAQAAAPEGFTVGTVGRCYSHGCWTVRGRGLPPTEMTESLSRYSTSSPVLKSNFAAMKDEWVQELLGYRKVEKLLTTYLRRFPELSIDGRLYGRFNQTGTKTGRLSSSEPNLQNIPSHGVLGEQTRALFRGNLVVGDYSQLEPRLMAHFSMDPLLVDIYQNGKDIYQETAKGIFGGVVEKESRERGIAKTLVLAMGYGAGANKVGQILTVNGFPTDGATAKAYLQELQGLYSTFFSWRDAVISRVKQRGYVTTLGGRHRRLKAAFADRRNWKNVGYGERQAVNAVVQGSAGDIVRRVMVETTKLFPELTLLAQVHDELVWEHRGVMPASTLESLATVAQEDHGFALNVPLVFEPHVGPSWFAAKDGIELPEDMNEESVGYEE